jgi:anti-sigma-K factor RskA
MNEDELQRIEPDCGEDAAPYVLGALTDDEHVAFLAHLESCAICRDEVAALQSVASALPVAVPQLNAPDQIKRRVMATVRSEAGLRGAGQPEPQLQRVRSRRTGWPGLLVPAGALAAVVAVVIISASGGSGGGARVIRAEVTAPGAYVSVSLSGGHAQLNLQKMPQSPPNHVYEVWIKRAGAPQPTDALFTVSSAGSATVGVPGSVSGVKTIMVTAEPIGGSKVPTSTPVIVARLS